MKKKGIVVGCMVIIAFTLAITLTAEKPIIVHANAQHSVRLPVFTNENYIAPSFIATNEDLSPEEWKASLNIQFDDTTREGTSYEQYNLNNLDGFRDYLVGLGYDVTCLYQLSLIGDRFTDYYQSALSKGIINSIQNDILLSTESRRGSQENNIRGNDINQIVPLWEAGGPTGGKMVYGNGGTHQVIAGHAYDHVRRMFPNLFTVNANTSQSRRAAFVRHTDWPDLHETQPNIAGIGLNNRHFYNPNNRMNYFRNTFDSGINARTRARDYFDWAVERYNEGRHSQAFNYLGKASHFLTDLASAVHADQLTSFEVDFHLTVLVLAFRYPALLIATPIALLLLNPIFFVLGISTIQSLISIATMFTNHTNFEGVAQSEISNGILGAREISMNTFRASDYLARPTHALAAYYLAGSVAARSLPFYSSVGGRGNVSHNNRVQGARALLPMATDATATMLYMFARTVGHTPVSLPTPQRWNQPVLTSNGQIAGTATAPYHLHHAFNGNLTSEWSTNATSGFIQLHLNHNIIINRIDFYNGTSNYNNRTRNAHFTAGAGTPLGAPFTAVNADRGRTIVHVNNVVTNLVRLTVTSSYGNWIGASRIVIHATTTQHGPLPWQAPVFTSGIISNNHGVLFGTYTTPYALYNAFNGNFTSEWSVNATTGWIQVTLNYFIRITRIDFYNGTSTANNRTRNAQFSTGASAIPLGSPFTAVNSDRARTIVHVNDIVTNTIRLNITSSYGTWVGASRIVIHGQIA
ncbi:MAG: hypothetical protein FWE16_01040 [Firmicutes bacterium]|nr:hypothetical protein [Bacillota bacterium]